MVTATALLGFGYTARLVARRQTERTDNQARDEMQAARAPAGETAAQASGPLGKEYLHLPVAVALGFALRQRGMGWRAGVPVAASIVSEALNRVVTHTLHIRVVPPGHPERYKGKPSFPSGHALETSAVALTSAYVLAREKLAPAALAFAVAGLLAAASSVGRLYLDRHWVSDAVGGSLLGIAVATACSAAYEALPAREVTAASSRGLRRVS
ncbi:MAG: phosphatase PAP2 family protein [Acidobacteria bacterium]|nr:phosphatase PAP2 family protein [Acidobacteriota bacterium]MCA1648727.1 phosphatase PAP2 family protein [Acidobacteriota bacterium]